MNIGIVSYNFYGGYVNYGAALQSYALQKALDKMKFNNTIVDYIPEHFRGINMGFPMRYMIAEGKDAVKRWLQNLVPIYVVDKKFKKFKNDYCRVTKTKYTKDNFSGLPFDTYVCGSDTIWSIWESKGFDDGFWANYPCMKNARCVAYSSSFADVSFTSDEEKILNDRLKNFSAIGLREPTYLEYVREHSGVPTEWTLDPTLLLTKEDYLPLAAERQNNEKYLLLYTRSRDKEIVAFADRIAKQNGWKVIEISLQRQHKKSHTMAYDAGIEQFLALIRDAECVVTNSFHGTIFSIQMEREFYTFTRPNCSGKIEFLLKRLGLENRMVFSAEAELLPEIDYCTVKNTLENERKVSLNFLKTALSEG